MKGRLASVGYTSFPDGGFENSWERGVGAQTRMSRAAPQPGLDPLQPLASREPDPLSLCLQWNTG